MKVVNTRGPQIPQRLSEKYRANSGFHYELIEREGTVAVYAQKYAENSEPIAYEIIRIQVAGNETFKGKYLPPYERVPSPSMWGRYGWSYHSLEDAMKKFDELVTKEGHTKEREIVIPKEVAA